MSHRIDPDSQLSRYSKFREVYERMTHEGWGVLPEFGFSPRAEGTTGGFAGQSLPSWCEVWRHDDHPTIEVQLKQRPDMNDPVAALVYVGGEKVNVGYNSVGLYNILRDCGVTKPTTA